MNEKEKKFCDEYLTDFNKTAAAVRAGYSKTYAWEAAARILKMPQAKEYINKKLNSISSKKDGAITVRDRMKAAELLGRLYGVFSEKGGSEEIIPVVISGENELTD